MLSIAAGVDGDVTLPAPGGRFVDMCVGFLCPTVEWLDDVTMVADISPVKSVIVCALEYSDKLKR